MTPTDIRNHTHESKRGDHARNRSLVLEALRQHGLCDTRSLAARMGWDVLAVRPRVTELVQAGLVILDGRNAEGGLYRVATVAEAQADHRARQPLATPVQEEFSLRDPRRRYY